MLNLARLNLRPLFQQDVMDPGVTPDPNAGPGSLPQPSGLPWWQQPPPPGFTGTWPPPLPPGASYGTQPGVINYPQPLAGNNPPGPNMYWDPSANNGSGGWNPISNPAATNTPPVGSGSTPTGGGGGGGGGGGLPSPFTEPFNAPIPLNFGGPGGLPNTPVFTPPNFTAPAPFAPPQPGQIQNDPGYQFALQQGEGAISNSQAAQGLWASGATGKAMQDYAQNYANQFYGDVYNRALNTYMTNVESQNVLPYQVAFQNAQAAFAPQMTGYSTQANYLQNQNQLSYSNAFNKWLADFNQNLGTAQFLQGVTTS